MLFEIIDKNSKDIVFVYTICSSLEEARDMGYGAVKNKLAISMDYWSVNSIYPWQNVIQEVEQYMLMFSTEKSLSQKLVKHIEAEHSYKIPMIVVTKTDMTNISYSSWVHNTLDDERKYSEESNKNKNDVNSLSKLK